MSKTIICIVGRTASGKDTFAGMLKEHGLKPVVSHTTRPIRTTETDGVQHHFISEEEAAEILKDRDRIAAYTEINGYKYFTTIDSLMRANIYVIDPNGIEYLRSQHPEVTLKVINIRCDRGVNQDHANIRRDDEEAFKKRFEAESEQFDRFEKEEQYDLLIWNNGSLDELREQADKLANEYISDIYKQLKPTVFGMHRSIDPTFDDIGEEK